MNMPGRAQAWVSGMANALPKQSVQLLNLPLEGDERQRTIGITKKTLADLKALGY
jgi:dihydrodipicolinate synthase/N-acetylneuraminate lyase